MNSVREIALEVVQDIRIFRQREGHLHGGQVKSLNQLVANSVKPHPIIAQQILCHEGAQRGKKEADDQNCEDALPVLGLEGIDDEFGDINRDQWSQTEKDRVKEHGQEHSFIPLPNLAEKEGQGGFEFGGFLQWKFLDCRL